MMDRSPAQNALPEPPAHDQRVETIQAAKDRGKLASRTGSPRPETPDPHAGILALHQSAGNHAVSQVIRAHSPRSRSAPTDMAPWSQPGDAAEVDAQAQADRAMRQPLPLGKQSDVPQASQKDAPLPTPLRQEMEARFGRNFGQIRLHTGDEASEAAKRVKARAFTLGNHIFFDQGEYRPRNMAGQRLLAHELAHTVQHRQGQDAGIQRLPNALSDAIPENERQRIRLITTRVDPASLAGLFSTDIATVTAPTPAGATVTFDAGIAQELRHGLQNVAGTIIPDPVHLNATITLDLDLTPHGGAHKAYRFTYVEHQPASRGGPTTQEILVEDLGEVTGQGVAPAQRTAQEQRFQQHGFRRGSGWSTSEYNVLLQAIALVPDGMLTLVDGLNFTRDAVHPEDASTGGDYDPDTHTVTMYDVNFDSSLTRFGMGGSAPAGQAQGQEGQPATGAGVAAPAGSQTGAPTLSSDAVRSVVHEIGHAIDLRPLRQAWTTYQQAGQALETAFAQYQQPDGSYQFPSSEQANWDRLNAAFQAAEQALTSARSESGHRYEATPSGRYETVEGPAGADRIPFRQAALRDGPTRLTQYSDEEWQEYYAESFSLYISDPPTLQRLRPNVYAYFTRHHPRA